MHVLVHPVVAFVLLKQQAELLHVEAVQAVQLLRGRLVIPHHPNGTSDCREGTEGTEGTDGCDALCG